MLIRAILNWSAWLAIGATAMGEPVSAQAVPANPLADIPPMEHARPPERHQADHRFTCDGQPFRVQLIEEVLAYPPFGQVKLTVVDTPYGQVGPEDVNNVNDALAGGFTLVSIWFECHGGDAALILRVRFDQGDDDGRILPIWLNRNTVSRIGP